MLLKNYTLKTMMPPCNPMAQTINALAGLSEDISEALPYLAATIKGCVYRHDNHTLRSREEAVTLNKGEIVELQRIIDRDREEALMNCWGLHRHLRQVTVHPENHRAP